MNTPESIASLFDKYLRNQCDAKELHFLSEALKKQPSSVFFDLMEKDWDTFEEQNIPDISFQKGDAVMNTILRKKRVSFGSKIHLKNWAAAACLALFIVGTAGAIVRWYQTQPVIYTSTPFRPLQLPDGTQVQLNHQAQVSYQESFWGDFRRVKLRGEAFFKVFPNKHQPFIIEGSRASIRVLGTQFNAKQHKQGLWVAVTEGKVVLSNAQGNSVSLVKNQWGQALDNGSLEVESGDVQNYLSWQEGRFLQFKNVAFPILVNQLERLYGVKMLWPASMRNKYLTSTSRYEPLAQLLPKLSLSLNINYRIENDTVVFSEK
ncbi:FecR domain-containing protein [Siphonobacter sp. SORGH_AS_0500]|uniref:FecR family protein n=1 Tax=Siphonobacter sp. SORGH_AS_0500 TaxID=1864824 RepID=UPI002858466D|nr:FecR domain-containing protein [Siphonobacter sp. SORGH_AS_0500]MDR6193315.1 transmembrane sensor [Siphonobacter sp. SORGH_AS_0500]